MGYNVSTIVFIEIPAFGHINPSLPLVRELIRRGQQVIYYTDAEFAPSVEATGATFRAYPPGVVTSRAIAQATQTGDMVRVPRVILRATESLVPFLLDQLQSERPKAVVLDSNVLWGHIAARILRLPTVSLFTTIVLGGPQYQQMSLREWLHMLRPALPSLVPILVARTRLLRQFKGPVVPRPAFPALGDVNLGLFPKDFQPPNPRIDATFRFVGPMLDPETRVDAPLELAGSGPLVYMSLGTLHRAATAFLRECLEAFADVPARFVISSRSHGDGQGLGQIPANCMVRASVPQLAVLQQADLFVTHGGMNSVLESLAHGVPMLVIPQQPEQMVIGLMLAERGAALVRREHVAGQRLAGVDVRRQVQHMLGTPRYQAGARQLQTLVAATGGYRQAADEVQRLTGATAAAG